MLASSFSHHCSDSMSVSSDASAINSERLFDIANVDIIDLAALFYRQSWLILSIPTDSKPGNGWEDNFGVNKKFDTGSIFLFSSSEMSRIALSKLACDRNCHWYE